MLRNLNCVGTRVDTARAEMTAGSACAPESLRAPESCTAVHLSTAPTAPRGTEHADAERYEVPGFAWVAGE